MYGVGCVCIQMRHMRAVLCALNLCLTLSRSGGPHSSVCRSLRLLVTQHQFHFYSSDFNMPIEWCLPWQNK